MMTLKDIQKRNAEFRARREQMVKKEEPEEAKKEVKGRRPKNRRNLVVGDERPEPEEELPEEKPEVLPEEKPEEPLPPEEKVEEAGE